MQDGELVNLGYLDLENVGTVGLGTCECGGCLSMEGNTALELEGLRISPVRADIPAALGLAQLSPQGISRIHGTAQLRNVHITAKNPLLLSGVALSGVVSIQAAAGVQMEDTTLTLGVPKNIRPNELGEIGLSCEKAISGEARGTLNIRISAEDASRLAAMGVRVIKLRFAPEMHATLVSDQLQPAGDGNPLSWRRPPILPWFLDAAGARSAGGALFSPFLRQEGLELLVGVVQTGAQGAFRHVGDFGDFREGKTLYIR